MLRAVFMLCILLLCPHSWGEAVSATLLGNVPENSGAALPGAEVQILESATGIAHRGVTNESGNHALNMKRWTS